MPKFPKRRHLKSKSTPKRTSKNVRKNTKRARIKSTKNKRGYSKAKRQVQSRPVKANKQGRTGGTKKSKLSAKGKASPHIQSIRQGKGGRKQEVQYVTYYRVRGQEKIVFEFHHVRKLDKKIDLVYHSPVIHKALKDQFKRKQGEPPLGLVVTVGDNYGRSHADFAPSDMVINIENTKEFIVRWLRALKANNVRWRERNKHLSNAERIALLRSMTAKQKREWEYDSLDPDNASWITVKFIYAKED